jgi:hypothetical protein
MVFLIAIMIPNLHGQVFEVGGGASSLYQAQGGTLAAHGPSYDASIGAGIVAGKFVGGANLTKMVGRSTYILGDDYIRFQLPTDIFDTSHYLVAQGAGVKTTLATPRFSPLPALHRLSSTAPCLKGLALRTFCGVWKWAETHHAELQRQRAAYRQRMGLES